MLYLRPIAVTFAAVATWTVISIQPDWAGRLGLAIAVAALIFQIVGTGKKDGDA